MVNDQGELLAFFLTPGNVDDRKPVPHLTKKLWGKLFGHKGYISQPLFEQLFEQGLQLVTPIRKNMKNRLMPLMDKFLVRKRAIIETINDRRTFLRSNIRGIVAPSTSWLTWSPG